MASFSPDTAAAAAPLSFDWSQDGGREVVDAARCTALLAGATARLNAPLSAATRVVLCNKSVTSGAVPELAAALGCMTSVTDADLSDMIASRPEAEALEVLRGCCEALASRELRTLDLSDNALGQKGIDACKGVLHEQDSLASVKFCNNGISAESAASIADILLYRGPEAPTALTTFHFYNNMCGCAGAASVSRVIELSPLLTDLYVSGVRAGRPGSLAVAKALQKCPAVTKLDLCDCMFAGAPGAAALAAALGACAASLTDVNLRDTALADEGFAPVANALRGAVRVTALDLSGNELTKVSAPRVARVAAAMPALATLKLDENELGSAGACGLAKLLKSPSLTALSVVASEVTSRGGVALAAAAPRNLPALAKLDLDGNAFSDAAVQEMMAGLEGSGKDGVLGEMDENDYESDYESDDESDGASGDDSDGGDAAEGAVDDAEVDALGAAMGKVL